MSVHTRILPGSAQDVDLTRILLREDIEAIKRTAGRFTVLLQDGRFGVGGSVGEALDKAKAPEAVNVRRAA